MADNGVPREIEELDVHDEDGNDEVQSPPIARNKAGTVRRVDDLTLSIAPSIPSLPPWERTPS